MEFLSDAEPLLRTFWFIAIPVSIIFVIQAIMTFVGMDSSDGVDADFDADLDHGDAPFQLFSFRNLTNFLLGFSWSGISFYGSINNKGLLVFIALLIGAGFVAAFFFMIQQIQKLAENNSFRIENALHKVCSVYLAIPERKTGKGKVQVSVNGSYYELDAVTENERIESNAMVRITKIETNSLVVVEKL